MAAEVGSGNGAHIDTMDSDSDSRFEGFTGSDIDEVDPRNSDDGFTYFEVDSSLDSESDASDGEVDDVPTGQRPVCRGRGRGAHRTGRGLDVDAPGGVSRLSGLTTSSIHHLFETGILGVLE